MKKYITAIIIIAIVVMAGWYLRKTNRENGFNSVVSGAQTLIATAVYSCDGGKTISASYYAGPEVASVPNQMPIPTGKVEITMGSDTPITLNQTISASGVRYANASESFVFWNKGDEALIMRDNAMDVQYKNCKASTTTITAAGETM